MIELYPKDSWNFIFGQASLEGMGIFSFARYDNNVYSRNYKGWLQKTKKLTPRDHFLFSGCYTPPHNQHTAVSLLQGFSFGKIRRENPELAWTSIGHAEGKPRGSGLETGIVTPAALALLQWIESGLSSVTSKDMVETEMQPHKPTRAFEESRLATEMLKCA
ncbi:UNVERIFIED_CONTAM: hypothetical protein FKN15_018402 [Acipenser sinensis]